MHFPVRLYLVKGMVQNDHFSIEHIESSDAEIAVLPEIMNTHRAAVTSRQESMDGRVLKNNVFRARGVDTTRCE
jgi:hypothetical protein